MDYGGVIKAAERLHLSQPSISAGLKALEDELGGALFDRSGPANRPLRLTPAGRRFYQHAQDILSQCETACAAFAGEPTNATQVRIGILDTLPQDLVTAAVHLCREHEPNLQINLWEGSASRLSARFAQERLDILWGNVSDLTPNTRILWREPLMAVVAPGHAYASNNVITLRDLAEEPFIHRLHCELDALGRNQLKAAGVKLNVQMRIEREELAFQLIRTGHGITLAPQSLIPPDLVAVTVTGLAIERSIGLQWQEKSDPFVLTTLTAALEEVLQPHPALTPAAPSSPPPGAAQNWNAPRSPLQSG